MIELIVETWSGPKGTNFRWSLWQDGSRIAMCGRPSTTVAACEAEGKDFCSERFQRAPERTTRL